MLFIIQPIVGKIVLPSLGGVPSVWTTCMIFFQTTLLVGYIYADQSTKRLGITKQSIIHIFLLTGSLIALPISIDLTGASDAWQQPSFWLLTRLAISAGFVFFLIASNAPMLQRWYSFTNQKDSNDPYFLYAASNIGSLAALLGYPFLIEPFISIQAQKHIWSAIYVFVSASIFICATIVWKSPVSLKEAKENEQQTKLHASNKQAFFWCFAGFVPCSGMLAVTSYISTDISSGPLLWIIPLSIYLFSFILVFAKTDYWREINWQRYLFSASVLVSMMFYMRLVNEIWFSSLLHLIFLFLLSMFFHSQLAKSRPAPSLLNSFFVWMSLGGILGGLFNGLAAPLLFNTQFEYIFTILLSMSYLTIFSKSQSEKNLSFLTEFLLMASVMLPLALFGRFSRYNAGAILSLSGILAVVLAAACMQLFFRFKNHAFIAYSALIFHLFITFGYDSSLIYVNRNFFGTIRVRTNRMSIRELDPGHPEDVEKDVFHSLYHGTTLHGVERRITDTRIPLPLSYYSRESPVGNVMRSGRINRRHERIGIIGLGCGTMAWYGRPWQKFDFFEIDPAMAALAKNEQYFSYLANSQAQWRIILGDARIRLNNKQDNFYDLIIIDAYSSDAIPTHLLTVEAFELYLQKLKEDGAILMHLSNRYFSLGPVVARICKELGLYAIESRHRPSSHSYHYDWYDLNQISGSYWVAVSTSKSELDKLSILGRWKSMKIKPEFSLWSDNHVNLLEAYNW